MITDADLWEIINDKKIKVNSIFMKDEPPLHVNYGGYIVNLQDEEMNEGGVGFFLLEGCVQVLGFGCGRPPFEALLDARQECRRQGRSTSRASGAVACRGQGQAAAGACKGCWGKLRLECVDNLNKLKQCRRTMGCG